MRRLAASLVLFLIWASGSAAVAQGMRVYEKCGNWSALSAVQPHQMAQLVQVWTDIPNGTQFSTAAAHSVDGFIEGKASFATSDRGQEVFPTAVGVFYSVDFYGRPSVHFSLFKNWAFASKGIVFTPTTGHDAEPIFSGRFDWFGSDVITRSAISMFGKEVWCVNWSERGKMATPEQFSRKTGKPPIRTPINDLPNFFPDYFRAPLPWPPISAPPIAPELPSLNGIVSEPFAEAPGGDPGSLPRPSFIDDTVRGVLEGADGGGDAPAEAGGSLAAIVAPAGGVAPEPAAETLSDVSIAPTESPSADAAAEPDVSGAPAEIVPREGAGAGEGGALVCELKSGAVFSVDASLFDAPNMIVGSVRKTG
ncbi:MAG TPA: hypothetical protein ENK83_03965, partial [Aliiroseovarius sp.]|nr:hypothetical protein [Aliiroseovarius sp.]